MKGKRSKPGPVPQTRHPFPIRHICGVWKSLCGSPDIKIYHDGKRFRLKFMYKQDTAFTVPLIQYRGITYFKFYGFIRIAYDNERDMLLLSTEGKYERVYNDA